MKFPKPDDNDASSFEELKRILKTISIPGVQDVEYTSSPQEEITSVQSQSELQSGNSQDSDSSSRTLDLKGYESATVYIGASEPPERRRLPEAGKVPVHVVVVPQEGSSYLWLFAILPLLFLVWFGGRWFVQTCRRKPRVSEPEIDLELGIRRNLHPRVD